MTTTTKQSNLVLSIEPVSRGFGFAVLDGGTLAKWGVKTASGADKNAQVVEKVKKLIQHYRPALVVTEDTAAKGSRRAQRIQELTTQIIALCAIHNVKLRRFSQARVRQDFFASEESTKYDLAVMVAKWFPAELELLVPPKRRFFDSENHRMPFFDAVALALMPTLTRRKSAAITDVQSESD